jgi:hypothetical protein
VLHVLQMPILLIIEAAELVRKCSDRATEATIARFDVENHPLRGWTRSNNECANEAGRMEGISGDVREKVRLARVGESSLASSPGSGY